MFRYFIAACLAFIYCAGGFAKAKDPQEVVSLLDTGMKGVKAEVVDSVKYSLLSRYIQEYRENGRREAYDSLEFRVRRTIMEHESSNAKTVAVFNPDDEEEVQKAVLSETDMLKEENKRLKAELQRLGGSKTQNAPQSRKRRTRYTKMMDDELDRIDRIADSLTQSGRGRFSEEDFSHIVVFDSMSRADFNPFFYVGDVDYYPKRDTLRAETIHRDLFGKKQFDYKVKRRVSYHLAENTPEFVDYYNLSPYKDISKDMFRGKDDTLYVNLDRYAMEPELDKLSKLLSRKRENEKWRGKGDFSMQFTQYYVSDNWHKGGYPNTTLLSEFNYERNYNNKNKVLWDNSLNVKIGFFNSRKDTIRAFRVYDDEFDISSRYSVLSFINKWYYTLQGEFKTSLFTSYSGVNSEKVVTSFMSPTRMFFGLGATYKHSKNMYAYISPVAYKLIFILGDRIEDPRTVGISEGHHSEDDWGYMLQGKLKWRFTREISVNSQFDLFASYGFNNVEFDWQTVGSFIINRYLSTKLSLNLRFDNTPKNTKEEKPSLQIQEQLTFGFLYSF